MRKSLLLSRDDLLALAIGLEPMAGEALKRRGSLTIRWPAGDCQAIAARLVRPRDDMGGQADRKAWSAAQLWR